MLDKEAEHWDSVARDWSRKSYANEILAEHKRNTYLGLIAGWADVAVSRKILKTDLFAEAFGPEQYLFYLAPPEAIVGIDIARNIVKQAKRQAADCDADSSRYLCCDVKHLPFIDNSFDLIISDSTLDHFPTEQDIVDSIKELGRVLRPGGSLILTIDNKSNLTYPPFIMFRLWMRLKLAPYYIGRTLSRSKMKQTIEDSGMYIAESTTIFHYPHPDGLVRLVECFVRNLGRGRLDGFIKKVLSFTDWLGERRSRYFTGRYLAIKAIKK
ncbi:class I SAM-dependent methyltransferase [Chloroflexota bacterium]